MEKKKGNFEIPKKKFVFGGKKKKSVFHLLGLRSTDEMRHFERNDHRKLNYSGIGIVLFEPGHLVDKLLHL